MDVILWVNDVVGKPWQDRADGPNAYDCWGLIVDSFRRVDGIEIEPVPGYQDGAEINEAGSAEQDSGRWQKIDAPKHGAIACYYDAQGSLIHVGRVVLLQGAGLHVAHAKGSVNSPGRVAVDALRSMERLHSMSGRVDYWERVNG